MARRYGGTQRRLRKTNCDCTSCINPEAGKCCLTAQTVLCCSTQSQYHVSDSTKSTHALSSNRLSKGTVLSIIMFEISTSSAPSAMECGAAFIGRLTIRPPSVLAWILFRCNLVCSRVFCTGCLGEVDMRVSQILRRLECMSMNVESDCYGSFAHGIGAELLTESVQVEGLGERRT